MTIRQIIINIIDFFFRGIVLVLETVILPFKKKRDILFEIKNEIMFSYCRIIYKNLSKDKRLRLWVCFSNTKRFSPENLRKIREQYKFREVSRFIARHIKWDLIIFPDHGVKVRNDCKKIFINHGLTGGGKIVNGESYVYGSFSRDSKGNIKYDKFFTSSEYEKNRIERLYPELASRVKIVGSLLVEEMVAFSEKREATLKSIGLDENRKTIMIISTWGPQSLVRNNGERILEKVPLLLQKYNVIMSIHHNNYVPKYSGGVDWKNKLDSVNLKNFYALTDKGEPFKCLACADILVTDMTSLGLYFTKLLRPIIFVDKEDTEYEEDSIILKQRDAAYVVNNIENIENDIEEAFRVFKKEEIETLSNSIFSYFGKAWERNAYELYETLGISIYER